MNMNAADEDRDGSNKRNRLSFTDGISGTSRLVEESGGDSKRIKCELPSEQEALAQLTNYFRLFHGRVGSPPAQFPCERVLFLLKCHQKLSIRKYQDGSFVWRRPLSFFIEAQASCEIIREIVSANIGFYNNKHNNKPCMPRFPFVAEAIRFGAKEGVVEFLVEKLPRSVLSPIGSRLPVALAILGPPHAVGRTVTESRQLLSILVPKFPHALVLSGILARSVWGDFGTGKDSIGNVIIDQYVEHCPRNSALVMPVKTSIAPTPPVGVNQVSALSRILPKLGSFTYEGRAWDDEALKNFLNDLARSFKGEKLVLSLPSNGVYVSQLKMVIKRNTHLKKLCLSPLQSDESNHASFLSAVADVAASSGTSGLESVKVTDLVLSPDGNPLEILLELCELHSFDLFAAKLDDDSIEYTIKGPGRINLFVTDASVPFDQYERFLSKVHQAPGLVDLALRGFSCSLPTPDATVPLIGLLGQKRLRKLGVDVLTVDWKRLEDVLSVNDNNLTELSLETTDELRGWDKKLGVTSCLVAALERGNTSLQQVYWRLVAPRFLESADCDSGNLDKIGYYTALNRYGRAETRKESLSRESFVRLLCAITDDDELDETGTTGHSVQYGLLRERPAMWSSFAR